MKTLFITLPKPPPDLPLGRGRDVLNRFSPLPRGEIERNFGG